MRRALDRLLIVLFCLALFVPLALTDWTSAGTTIGIFEKRRAPPFPPPPASLAAAMSYPAGISTVFADRFGLRHAMVDLYGRIEILLLRHSPSADVTVGTNGFLFYNGWETTPDWQHLAGLPPPLAHAWVAGLRRRAAWLAARNIRYLFVIAPNKQTIYPEFMPPQLARFPGATRRELIDAAIGPAPYLLDLTGDLRAAKPQGLLFFRLDSHWTPAGAMIGYRAIMQRLGIDPPDWRHAADSASTPFTPDLALLTGVSLTEPRHDPPPNACARPLPDLIGLSLPGLNTRPIAPQGCAARPGRLLMFHDSFAVALAPLLAESFGRVAYVAAIPTDAEVARAVALEQPTIVIEERVERELAVPLQ
jgi:hypothetical protein